MMKKILKIIGLFLAIVIVAIGGGIALLTGLEYDPPATENLEIAGSSGCNLSMRINTL